MTDEERLKKLNEAMQCIVEGLGPIIDLSAPIEHANHEVYHALAQFYASEPLRKFLINKYKQTLQETAIGATDTNGLMGGKMRAAVILEILTAAKHAYSNVQKLDTISKKIKR